MKRILGEKMGLKFLEQNFNNKNLEVKFLWEK